MIRPALLLLLVVSTDALTVRTGSSNLATDLTKESPKGNRRGNLIADASSFKKSWPTFANYGHPSWLNDCESIYLDVGTNIGIQIRKLFEPEKYPDAAVQGSFNQVFGEDKSLRSQRACALGMEPNPNQQPRLQALEKAYNQRGFRTHIYPFAAWSEEGSLDFHTGMKDFGEEANRVNSENEEWGAHVEFQKREVVHVRAVDLAAFIKSLPRGKVKLMKLDIEGAEYETLAHAIPENVMCADTISQLFMETHDWGHIEKWNDARGIEAIGRHISEHDCHGSTPTTLLKLDDESYVHDVDDNFSGNAQ